MSVAVEGQKDAGRQVGLDRWVWAAVRVEARRRGMSGSQFAGLIVKNWLARRWPLELMPEERQEVDRGVERLPSGQAGSVEKSSEQ